jgi:phosphatidylcholine synthase
MRREAKGRDFRVAAFASSYGGRHGGAMIDPRDAQGDHPPVSRRRRAAALGVHLFTASGAALGLMALLAAAEKDFTSMFAWLAAALLVDGLDGGLARKAEVGRAAPEISGDTLDLVVDYVTYVLVPAYALTVSGLLPSGLAAPAAVVICVSSALYFALTAMKTDDWYFRGFPAVWNIAVFYLFLIRPPGPATFAVVLALAALSFAPVVFVHPFRVRRLRWLTITMLAVWGALAAVAILQDLRPDGFVIAGLVSLGLYFLGLGLSRSLRR